MTATHKTLNPELVEKLNKVFNNNGFECKWLADHHLRIVKGERVVDFFQSLANTIMSA